MAPLSQEKEPPANPGRFKTEMSLQVLAYNLKKMIAIFGVRSLIQAIA